ncbi:MAG: bifunctional diguanylate cyclase/phosphodiesterase [Paracoccaceae bacterium]
MLGGYWFGGEAMLLFLALVFPAAFAIAGVFSGTGPAWSQAKDRETNLPLAITAERALNRFLNTGTTSGKNTAALAVVVDDFAAIKRQYGRAACTTIMRQTAKRLAGVLRETDAIVRLDGPRFGIAMGPVRRADLETLIQMSARLQAAVADPISIDATRVFVTISVGFCLASRAPVNSGAVLLEMAEYALAEAVANGCGSIRAYSPPTKQRSSGGSIAGDDVFKALEDGHIKPWYQPQVSTHTGEITGFEALARWEHPTQGLIPPSDFLPVLQEMDGLEKLSETILSNSLSALRQWDKSGLIVPNVAVNFSSQELSNPKLCERLKWELDRYELTPDRLCIEILEDVIAESKDDVIVRNIQALSDLGCPVDLDDFGTGYASITNIRRFSVNRIKIDRSFITRVDRDREQQNMVAAILTMAERLEIDTLAEGVETVGEHAILAQLGCGHVQGFSIARPMPFEATEKWIIQHCEKLPKTPALGHKSG